MKKVGEENDGDNGFSRWGEINQFLCASPNDDCLCGESIHSMAQSELGK